MILLSTFADTITVQQSSWRDGGLNILAGFILALVLFVLQDWWRARRQSKRVMKYCRKEIEHDIDVLEKCIDSTKRLRQEITENTKTIYFDFSAENILYKFTADAHALGLLFDELSSEEIAKLNADVFTFFGNITGYVSTRINEYQSDSITPSDMIATLKWVGDKADEAVKTLKAIKKKLA